MLEVSLLQLFAAQFIRWCCQWRTGSSCEERTRFTEETIKEGKKDVSNNHEGIMCMLVDITDAVFALTD